MTTQTNGAPQISKSGPGATAPAAPQQTAPAPDPLAEAKRLRDEAQATLAAAAKRSHAHAIEARKFADEKKGIGAKLSEYEELKKYKAEQERLTSQAKLNKAAFLERHFGKDWYDEVVKERLNGGAPTADTVALEVSKLEERFEAKLAEREAAAKEAAAKAEQERTQQELRSFVTEATEYAASSAKDFPALEDEFGTHEEIGAALVRVVRAEYERTTQRDESGVIMRPGRIMTLKEAAEGAEKYLLERAVKLAGRDKYREKLTGALKPAQAGSVGGTPQLRSTEVERRTLSNGLTATASGQKRATRTEEERRAAAFAAVDAVKQRQA